MLRLPTRCEGLNRAEEPESAVLTLRTNEEVSLSSEVNVLLVRHHLSPGCPTGIASLCSRTGPITQVEITSGSPAAGATASVHGTIGLALTEHPGCFSRRSQHGRSGEKQLLSRADRRDCLTPQNRTGHRPTEAFLCLSDLLHSPLPRPFLKESPSPDRRPGFGELTITG